MNRCYGAKYFTLYCMEKHQGVRTFNTNSKTSPKYILKKQQHNKNNDYAIHTDNNDRMIFLP